MAVTRKLLRALGIEDEKADQILEAHTETLTQIRQERDKYKADAEKLPGVQQELEELRAAAEKDAHNPYKAQYEAVKKQFDDYKADVEAQQVKSAKVTAYRKMLTDAGVSEKAIDLILKATELDDLELTEQGEFKNAEELKKTIPVKYDGFIVKEETHGAPEQNPPGSAAGGSSGGGAVKSRAAQLAEQYNNSLYGSVKEGK